jgi:hypothetical protein
MKTRKSWFRSRLRSSKTPKSITPMATVHAPPALQAMIEEDGLDNSSKLPPTDPHMILSNRDIPSTSHQAGEFTFLGSDTEPSPSSSVDFLSPTSTESFEIGTARSFLMPMRSKPAPPSSNHGGYPGYSHGAPLSVIGEEDSTPKSKRARSRTPSPSSSPTVAPHSPGWWNRKPEKRLSELSSSSSISNSSDTQWEGFDTRAGMSDRLRADLAAAGDDTLALDGFGSRRDSTTTIGEDENTSQALSTRAEQILASAKLRLTVGLLVRRFVRCLICY